MTPEALVQPHNAAGPAERVRPDAVDTDRVHSLLAKHQLADGFPIVLDLERSHGVWLVDGRRGGSYLDCFTGFASWPIGYNHPMMADPDFAAEIGRTSLANPANSDLYTTAMASFVEAFGERVTPPEYPYHFWISGGALAVENAMKTAFDWKARKLGRTSMQENVDDLVIIHFEQAFHGRSGYTMSVTNTVPDKVGLFPRFPWPRIHNPFLVFDLEGNVANDIEAEEERACAELDAAFAAHGRRVAAILIEPIQGEGGDNHFRPEFLAKLRAYADEGEALLIFDEVQTGFFGSGKPWFFQHIGVEPDVVAFGKKSQVCGIFASKRIDEVEDNVFHRSSRINSTWGGNLTDMVRSRRFIEIIEAENLAENITARGSELIAALRSLSVKTGAFDNVRGLGSLIAVSFSTPERRDQVGRRCFEEKLMLLSSGTRSLRFRLPLIIDAEEIQEVPRRLEKALAGS